MVTSWVIVRRSDGKAIIETLRVPEGLDASMYRAIPILEYLQTLNAAIDDAGGVNPEVSPFADHERLIVQNEEHRKRLSGADRKGMSR